MPASYFRFSARRPLLDPDLPKLTASVERLLSRREDGSRFTASELAFLIVPQEVIGTVRSIGARVGIPKETLTDYGIAKTVRGALPARKETVDAAGIEVKPGGHSTLRLQVVSPDLLRDRRLGVAALGGLLAPTGETIDFDDPRLFVSLGRFGVQTPANMASDIEGMFHEWSVGKDLVFGAAEFGQFNTRTGEFKPFEFPEQG